LYVNTLLCTLQHIVIHAMQLSGVNSENWHRWVINKWSIRRRDFYLTTHNTHKRQTPMLTAGFEPAIPVTERPQAHTLDRAANGIDSIPNIQVNNIHYKVRIIINEMVHECKTKYRASLLLSLLSLSCRLFTIIYLKQTMFLGYILLQLFCFYNLCYM